MEPEILIEGEGPQPPDKRQYTAAERLGMRFVALFSILFFALWIAVAASLLILCGLLHLVTLGRLESLPSLLARQWQATCFGLACFLGAFVALFSPRFGLGIGLLYLVLNAEQQSPFADQFRTRFQSAYYRF